MITTLDVPISKTTDNNTMFKVNLGTLVDKPVSPVVPTIKTQAHSKDGDKIIQINEVSEKTPLFVPRKNIFVSAFGLTSKYVSSVSWSLTPTLLSLSV